MKLESTDLEGVFLVHPIVRPDERGSFVKTFQASVFEEAGLQTNFPEHFFSESKKGVVRGLHFQTPPAAQDKLVFCPAGEVMDVVVDVRAGSPTYGQHVSFRLSSEDWTAAYIPVGFAHGFVALSEAAVMAYLVSAEYDARVRRRCSLGLCRYCLARWFAHRFGARPQSSDPGRLRIAL